MITIYFNETSFTYSQPVTPTLVAKLKAAYEFADKQLPKPEPKKEVVVEEPTVVVEAASIEKPKRTRRKKR